MTAWNLPELGPHTAGSEQLILFPSSQLFHKLMLRSYLGVTLTFPWLSSERPPPLRLSLIPPGGLTAAFPCALLAHTPILTAAALLQGVCQLSAHLLSNGELLENKGPCLSIVYPPA